ncbi:MAG: ABC transporter permease, partial [Ruminococcus sp.]|nr:ABC transporter permease [Ruminococcus sp.]
VYNNLGYSINGEKKNYIEIDGIVSETASTTLENSYDFDTQWGCIGQGDTLVSPLQMMLWQSAIANTSGKMTMPYLIDHVTNVKGKITDRAETKLSKSVFSAETAQTVKEIMLENGKNYSETISGYELGIKSGTAQVKNGEEENSLLAGFVNDRRHPIAFCVLIEDKNSGNLKSEYIVKTMLDALCA